MNDATVIRAEAHQIPPDAIDADAVKVIRRLKEHGHDAYIVGGAVRDLVLGRRPKDFDVATAATPDQIRELFRNSRTIGRRFPIVHVYFKDRKVVEVSTFRREPNSGDEQAESARNKLWGTAADDAKRRDLTINGFFLDPDSMEILDFVGGMADLKNSVIRIIGDPVIRIQEDPVRMIRAIRHAARTGFLIEPNTWNAIVTLRHTITTCNESRLRQEFVREFQEGAAARSLKLLHKSGLLAHLLPHFDNFLLGLESRPEQKRVYWKLIKLLDQEGAKHDLPGELIFAAAFGPALMPDLLAIFPEKAQINVDKVIKRLDPFLAAAGIPKAMAESLAQALYAQPRLDAARSGSIPKRIANKSYFPLALHLFLLRHQAIGSFVPEEWVAAAPRLNGPAVTSADNASGKGKRHRRGKPDGERNGDGSREQHSRGGSGDSGASSDAGAAVAPGEPQHGSADIASSEPTKKKRRRGGRGRKKAQGNGDAISSSRSETAAAVPAPQAPRSRTASSGNGSGGASGETPAGERTGAAGGSSGGESGDGAKKRGRRGGRRRRKPSRGGGEG